MIEYFIESFTVIQKRIKLTGGNKAGRSILGQVVVEQTLVSSVYVFITFQRHLLIVIQVSFGQTVPFATI